MLSSSPLPFFFAYLYSCRSAYETVWELDFGDCRCWFVMHPTERDKSLCTQQPTGTRGSKG